MCVYSLGSNVYYVQNSTTNIDRNKWIAYLFELRYDFIVHVF